LDKPNNSRNRQGTGELLTPTISSAFLPKYKGIKYENSIKI